MIYTLAYYKNKLFVGKKSFITLGPGLAELSYFLGTKLFLGS